MERRAVKGVAGATVEHPSMRTLAEDLFIYRIGTVGGEGEATVGREVPRTKGEEGRRS